jgi:hypothetical protein
MLESNLSWTARFKLSKRTKTEGKFLPHAPQNLQTHLSFCRYIQVETAFFWKWWSKQREETRSAVIDLVNSGQLEMVGGGWSMNDEAAAHYQSIIDQFTWGFR